MRSLLACFCFDEGSFSGHDLAQLITETVEFETPLIMTDVFLKNGGPFNRNEHLKRISNSSEVGSVRLGFPTFEGNSFVFGRNGSWDFEFVSWRCPLDHLPERAIFDSLSMRSGFNAGCISDAEDVQWQSEPLISNYELFGKSHKGLPKLWDEDFQEEQIDTLQNPGARHPIPGMWLQAAWRMWFGPGAFRFIPKERLQAFRDAHRIELLDDASIFIELFSNPDDFDSAETRAKQASFNDWVGKQSLVAKGTDLDCGPSDPSHEIEHGEFDHGGSKRFTVWLDENDKPVVKSRAKSRLIQELDDDSIVVWTEKREIG